MLTMVEILTCLNHKGIGTNVNVKTLCLESNLSSNLWHKIYIYIKSPSVCIKGRVCVRVLAVLGHSRCCFFLFFYGLVWESTHFC